MEFLLKHSTPLSNLTHLFFAKNINRKITMQIQLPTCANGIANVYYFKTTKLVCLNFI